MNKDHIKGMANQATGEIKEKVGKMTGDRSTELSGHLREAKGKAQEKMGDAKDRLQQDKDVLREEKERDIELNRANEDVDRMGRR